MITWLPGLVTGLVRYWLGRLGAWLLYTLHLTGIYQKRERETERERDGEKKRERERSRTYKLGIYLV